MAEAVADGYITVERAMCGSCGACVAVCPPEPPALIMHALALTFYAERCVECDNCVAVCPIGALGAKR